MKTDRTLKVDIGGKLYAADAIVQHNGTSYIAHDLARRLKRKARKPALKFWNVAISYRTCGYPGAFIGAIKATTKEDAIAIGESQLRAKEINLTIKEATATLSGWNR